MKKTILILSLCAVFLLSACQATPEVPPVVNKEGGIVAGREIPRAQDGEPKDVGVPQHWTEQREFLDGCLKIDVDADVTMPEVSNTPVWEFEQRQLTDDDLQKYVEYFAAGNQICEPQRLTKQQLERELERFENAEDGYGDVNYEYSTSNINYGLNELLKTAPETAQQVPAKIAYVYPPEDDFILIRRGEYTKQISKNTFKGQINYPDESVAKITSTRFDGDAGSNSSFIFEHGNIYSEAQIKALEGLRDRNDVPSVLMTETAKDWMVSYKRYLENLNAVMERDKGITQEQAQKTAEAVLYDLGITDFKLYGAERGVQLLDQDMGDIDCAADYDFDMERARSGYCLTFQREIDGLMAYVVQGDNITVMGRSDDDYRMPFTPEQLTLFVTDEGVQLFDWQNMVRPVAMVAENTQLLPFEEIMPRIIDNIRFGDFVLGKLAEGEADGSFKSLYKISGVTLSAAYVPAYGNPQNVWLVPVWMADMAGYFQPRSDEPMRLSGYSKVMICALDGSVVGF